MQRYAEFGCPITTPADKISALRDVIVYDFVELTQAMLMSECSNRPSVEVVLNLFYQNSVESKRVSALEINEKSKQINTAFESVSGNLEIYVTSLPRLF